MKLDTKCHQHQELELDEVQKANLLVVEATLWAPDVWQVNNSTQEVPILYAWNQEGVFLGTNKAGQAITTKKPLSDSIRLEALIKLEVGTLARRQCCFENQYGLLCCLLQGQTFRQIIVPLHNPVATQTQEFLPELKSYLPEKIHKILMKLGSNDKFGAKELLLTGKNEKYLKWESAKSNTFLWTSNHVWSHKNGQPLVPIKPLDYTSKYSAEEYPFMLIDVFQANAKIDELRHRMLQKSLSKKVQDF